MSCGKMEAALWVVGWSFGGFWHLCLQLQQHRHFEKLLIGENLHARLRGMLAEDMTSST